jgi:hypothetical protein
LTKLKRLESYKTTIEKYGRRPNPKESTQRAAAARVGSKHKPETISKMAAKRAAWHAGLTPEQRQARVEKQRSTRQRNLTAFSLSQC